jgi:hypothetical protein
MSLRGCGLLNAIMHLVHRCNCDCPLKRVRVQKNPRKFRNQESAQPRVQTHIHTHMHIYVCKFMCVCVCVCVCAAVCWRSVRNHLFSAEAQMCKDDANSVSHSKHDYTKIISKCIQICRHSMKKHLQILVWAVLSNVGGRMCMGM